MRDWTKIKAATVFDGKDENGNRFLTEFLRDYKTVFDPDIINAGCRRCLEDYYFNLTSKLHRMTKVKNSGYRLKEKYNGIPLKFGSAVQVFNTNLSDEYAEELLKNHPAGADLFDKVPEAAEKSEEDQLKELLKLKRPELDAKATELGIDPSDYSKKDEVAAAILDVLSAEVK